MTVYTLGVIEIVPSGRVSVFLCFTQKFKIAAKMAGKTIFGQNCQMTVDTQGLKNFVEVALYCIVYEILMFFIVKKNCDL